MSTEHLPFALPPYPYDRVAALGKLAQALPGGCGRLLDWDAVRPSRPRGDRGPRLVGERAGVPRLGR